MRAPLAPLAALLLAIASAGAAAPRAPLCSEGVFVVEGAPLLSRAGRATPDVLTLAEGSLTVASLGITVPVELRTTERGTRLVATLSRQGGGDSLDELAAGSWNVLYGLFGVAKRPVILKARIAPDCLALEGRIRGGGKRLRRSFDAQTPPGEPACPDACGGFFYCHTPPGLCEDVGVCMPRPDTVATVWLPVCGCDGVTYSNETEAAAAAANVLHTGACESECGTIVGIPCGAGEFCELPEDTCQTADLGGICVPIGDVCTHQYDPVCGCDGVTYGNDCERRAAYVSKAHDGACESSGDGVK